MINNHLQIKANIISLVEGIKTIFVFEIINLAIESIKILIL